MTQRERTLAIAVGALLGIVVLFYGYQNLTAGYNKLATERENLEAAARKIDETIDLGIRATSNQKEIAKRSLHPDRDKASSMYRAWLYKIVESAKLQDRNIKGSHGRLDKSKLFHLYNFDVTGRGNLQQITQLLHDFYSIDHLHRVRRIYLRPVPKKKVLDMTLNIEVMSLVRSQPRDTPMLVKANRLDKKDLKTYIDGIVNRNFFSKANIAPEFASSSVPPAIIGRSYSHKIKASDADRDGLKFELVKAPQEFPLKVDESGTVSVEPKKLGDFMVAIRITDDGLPPKSKVQEFRFRVEDPPPPPKKVVRVEPPKFDTAKLAFLTAIIETDGKHEIWVNLRNEDRTLRLHIGDAVKVGLLDGRIVGISPRKVVIKKTDGKVVAVSLGKNLADAEEQPSAGE